MEIEKNKSYKFKINHFGKILYYEGKVVYSDKDEFQIKTENSSCPLQFKPKDVMKIEKIAEQKKENRVHLISNKKQFTNLKKADIPEGL